MNKAYVPANLVQGEYYWGVIADKFNWVSESNELNNAQAGDAVTVTVR